MLKKAFKIATGIMLLIILISSSNMAAGLTIGGGFTSPPKYTIYGNVYYSNGGLASGATVKVYTNGVLQKTVLTSTYGSYSVTLYGEIGESSRTFTLEIIKGYWKATVGVTVSANTGKKVDVTLHYYEPAWYMIYGYVTSEGHPVSNVRVEITSTDSLNKVIYTDSNGLYQIKIYGTVSETYRTFYLHFSHDGLVPKDISFRMNAKTNHREDVILLKPALLVLVHGFFSSPDAMTKIKDEIGEYYVKTIMVDLYDGDPLFGEYNIGTPIGSDGGLVDKYDKTLAHKLYTIIINEVGSNHYDYIDIIAHSMGGLVSRSMIVDFANHGYLGGVKIRNFITLGTPHQGTYLANWAVNYIINNPSAHEAIYVFALALHCAHGTSYDDIKSIVTHPPIYVSPMSELVQLMEGSTFITYLNLFPHALDNINVYTIAGTPTLSELSNPPTYLLLSIILSTNSPGLTFYLNFLYNVFTDGRISSALYNLAKAIVYDFFNGNISFNELMSKLIEIFLTVGMAIVDDFLLAFIDTLESTVINDGLVTKASALLSGSTTYTVNLHHGHLTNQAASLSIISQILNP